MRALILEGGAMRGIFTAGVLDGLAEGRAQGDNGHQADFDLVIGVSSGAYCAASFLAGQHGRILRIIHEHMTSSNYANPYRMLRGGSAIDQDYLMGPVTRELDPLDVSALRSAKTRFEVVATNARTGRPEYLPCQDEDCLDALHATVAVPVFYRGGPIRFRGEDYFDGSVSDPIPVTRALALGATEITVVLTRALGDIPSPIPTPARLGLGLIMMRHLPIARAIVTRHHAFASAHTLLEKLDGSPTLRLFAPPADFPVGKLTRNRERILEGFEIGRRAALS